MLKALALACALVLASSISQAQAPARPGKVTVVHAAHMLDGVSKSMQGPVTVVLTDGLISSVQPGTHSVEGAEVIDLGDATLLPGLIDAHKHMGPPNTGM
jgi:imidazolonepropionase-like amidohydrolase